VATSKPNQRNKLLVAASMPSNTPKYSTLEYIMAALRRIPRQ
jgi:hypothetical protein